MRSRVFLLAMAVGPGTAPFFGLAEPARAAPADTLGGLSAQIAECLIAPVDGELTLLVTFSREGVMLGTPHISYNRLPLDEAQQRHVTETLTKALDRCLPVEIAPALGRSIAGRRLTLRFIVKRRETDI